MPSRRQLANAIRVLSMDAVQQANSGHPGAPMGMADMAEVLWNDFLRHNPADPKWPDRDRFVMSNGHGSMLLYALLHLSGYDLSIKDIQQFRQLHSKTPGHPEHGYTPGIEATTGPLGQGIANAVGMAIAERGLAAEFNRGALDIVNHYTYFSAGDGCLMEGISHEAASLAGTLRLGKLIGLYDSNQISIDGDTRGWFTDDTAARFKAYGWHVIDNIDGHSPAQIINALNDARSMAYKPSLICCRTVIGWGSPNKQGKAASHGAPLGADEIALTRKALDWEYDAFIIPDEYYTAWDARERGAEEQAQWQEKFDAYAEQYPQQAAEFKRRIKGQLPASWAVKTAEYISNTADNGEDMASRQASQRALDIYGKLLPELIGGSADLTGSNLTRWSGSETFNADTGEGNYIYYGVREFGMCAINNGIALHGGYIPYAGTFLIFSEYARNALRMAALMRQRTIFVLTHDSIGLGEDGPTHQAVEQAATLRLIPNMTVWRPCDDVESAVAWKMALEKNDGPSSLLFSRQKLSHIRRAPEQLDLISKGAYILMDSSGKPEIIVIATGSEVQPAIQAATHMNGQGYKVRVVSMPCAETFDSQESCYRNMVLPPDCRRRLAVEAGISDYWRKYVGLDGRVAGVDDFGESASADDVFKHFELTTEKLEKIIEELART